MVAGGIIAAITPIQMVCTKAEVEHEVLHRGHFEEKDILESTPRSKFDQRDFNYGRCVFKPTTNCTF